MAANDALLGAFSATVFTGLVAVIGNAFKNARDKERNAIDADGGLRKDTMATLTEARQENRELRADLARAQGETAAERTARFHEMELRLKAETHADACERRAADLQRALEAIEERHAPRPLQGPTTPSGTGPAFLDDDAA